MIRVGAIFSFVVAAACFQASPSLAGAHGPGFGAPLEQMAKAYKTTAVLTPDGRALVLPGTEIAGMHFDRVALLFDSDHRLQKIRMMTTTEGYDRVRDAMAAQLVSPSKSDVALLDAADAADDTQIRVCEDEKGQVIVTFEKASLNS